MLRITLQCFDSMVLNKQQSATWNNPISNIVFITPYINYLLFLSLNRSPRSTEKVHRMWYFSLQCSVWHCWLGDRNSIQPIKGWVLVCWWWRFDWSFARLIAPVVTSIILSSNKIQNGDILVPAYLGCPRKWPSNECCQTSVVRTPNWKSSTRVFCFNCGQSYLLNKYSSFSAFCALTLLVGWQLAGKASRLHILNCLCAGDHWPWRDETSHRWNKQSAHFKSSSCCQCCHHHPLLPQNSKRFDILLPTYPSCSVNWLSNKC